MSLNSAGVRGTDRQGNCSKLTTKVSDKLIAVIFSLRRKITSFRSPSMSRKDMILRTFIRTRPETAIRDRSCYARRLKISCPYPEMLPKQMILAILISPKRSMDKS